MTNCANCKYIVNYLRHGGYCYMFEEKLEGCKLNQHDYATVLARVLKDHEGSFFQLQEVPGLVNIKTREI